MGARNNTNGIVLIWLYQCCELDTEWKIIRILCGMTRHIVNSVILRVLPGTEKTRNQPSGFSFSQRIQRRSCHVRLLIYKHEWRKKRTFPPYSTSCKDRYNILRVPSLSYENGRLLIQLKRNDIRSRVVCNTNDITRNNRSTEFLTGKCTSSINCSLIQSNDAAACRLQKEVDRDVSTKLKK